MCGTPQRSRTTRTGWVGPSSVRVPDTCGSHEAGTGSLLLHAAATSVRLRTTTSRTRRTMIKETLLAEYDHEMGTTRRLLERVPDAQLAWKPHEKSMTLGGLATHLGNIPNWGSRILNESFFDLAGAPPNLESKASRAAI